jgi:hypothetical protein
MLAVVAFLVAGCGGVTGSPAGNEASPASTGQPAASLLATTNVPNADGVVAGDLAGLPTDVPTFDANALVPSPGAAALRALAALEPGVAGLIGDVAAAEGAALKIARAKLPAQPAAWGPGAAILAVARPRIDVAASPATPQGAANAQGAVFLGGFVSGMSDLLTPDVPVGAGVSGSGTDTQGGATATLSLDLGRSVDGSTNFGIGIQINVAKGGVTAKVDAAASVAGLRCPDAQGQVKFTVKVRLGAESGATALTEDLTATITATVNDDATIGDAQLDIVQGTRRVQDGRQVYVETGLTSRFVGHDYAAAQFTNIHMVRKSQQATIADVGDLSFDGHTAAQGMGLVALFVAENNWRSGGCVKIVATSSGRVDPASTTAIPVTVLGRYDGAVVPAKLEAVLAGGASLDPTLLAQTPGTLTYTAPSERGKAATISLTATSRRGIAKLDLTANTGGQGYTASGGGTSGRGGTITISGTVADVTAPFTLDGVFPGGGATFAFTPKDEHGGAYTFTGGFGLQGGGTYTITGAAGGPLTLTYVGQGCVGVGSCSDTHAVITLTPQGS